MAAGIGTRMRSETPKHLHVLLGRRMVDWVLDAVRHVAREVVVVASPETAGSFDGVAVAVQEQPLGTGDAVRAALAALPGHEGDVLVVSGDTPLLSQALLEELVAAHRSRRPAATVLSAEPAEPRSYGRVVRA